MVAQWLARLSHFDLRDLSVERVSNGPLRLKALVALLLVSAVLVMGYGLMLRAPLNQLAQQRDAEVMLHGEFVAKAAQVASLEAQLLSMHELEAAFSDVLKQLPGQAQVPGLLDDMSRLGQTSGLQIEHIQWSPEVLQPFYAELPLKLVLIGGYHDLGHFVSQLAGLPRIVTLHDFTLTPLNESNDGQLRMTLLAKTYRTYDQG